MFGLLIIDSLAVVTHSCSFETKLKSHFRLQRVISKHKQTKIENVFRTTSCNHIGFGIDPRRAIQIGEEDCHSLLLINFSSG